MKDVYGNPLPSNIYEANETMKMLGDQHVIDSFWRNTEVRKEIEDIAEVHPRSFTIDAAADIFSLGYIHGERASRIKGKGQELSTSAEYRKKFILREVEKMNEENIGLIYAFVLGRTGKSY